MKEKILRDKVLDIATDEQIELFDNILRGRDEALAKNSELTTAPSGRTEPPLEEPVKLCAEQSPFVAEFIRSGCTNTPVDGVIMQQAHAWYNACAARSYEVRQWGWSWMRTALGYKSKVEAGIEACKHGAESQSDRVVDFAAWVRRSLEEDK